MKQVIYVKRGRRIKIDEVLQVYFYNAGHEAGSSSIMLNINNGSETYRVYFSGDIGQGNPILKRRVDSFKKNVDFVIMESTYADRIKQDKKDSWKKIREIIANTILKGGDAVFPLTAGRIPGMIYLCYKDMMENDDWVAEVLRKTPIIVDSSMAVKIIHQFKNFVDEFSADAVRFMKNKENNMFNFPNLIMAENVEDSRKVISRKQPYIVLSTAGMCNAGRILYHLKKDLVNPKSSIIFTIYQAEGTLGNRIVNHSKKVTVLGESVDVEAKVVYINAFSEHADQNELIKWLSSVEKGYKLFLNHGEPAHQKNLKSKLVEIGMLEEKDIELMAYGKIYQLYKGRVESSTFNVNNKKKRKNADNTNKRNIQAIQKLHAGVQSDFFELFEPEILRVLNSLGRDVKRERMIYRKKKERLERIYK